MIKIMFVCHGNICRSPMAEFVMKDLVRKNKLDDKIYICSSATSDEAIGRCVHQETANILLRQGINCDGKTSVKMIKSDYDEYDYIVAMDYKNIKNINNIVGIDYDNKVCRLLDITDDKRDILDPWYTGDFEQTYKDISKGCMCLLEKIKVNLK